MFALLFRSFRRAGGHAHVLGVMRIMFGLWLFVTALTGARESMYSAQILNTNPVEPVWLTGVRILAAVLVTTGHASSLALVGFVLANRYASHRFGLSIPSSSAECAWIEPLALLLAIAPTGRALSLTRASADADHVSLVAVRLGRVLVALAVLGVAAKHASDPNWHSGATLEPYVLKGALLARSAGLERAYEWISTKAPGGLLEKAAFASEVFVGLGLFGARSRPYALWWATLVLSASAFILPGYIPFVPALVALLFFATHDYHARVVYFDGARFYASLAARLIKAFDWLGRFELRAWGPDGVTEGRAIVLLDRDGQMRTGLFAWVLLARTLPIAFFLWAPLALLTWLFLGDDRNE